MTDPNDEDESHYALVMPFVVCESNGGPYEDQAFVGGCWYGKVEAECKTIMLGSYRRWTVPSALVPQLDLLAMHEGLEMDAEPWEEAPDEWTTVTMGRGRWPSRAALDGEGNP